MLLTSIDGEHPRAIDERGLMPYVLSMTTGQIGNPVALFILVIADDRLLHRMMIHVSQTEGDRDLTEIRLAQLKVTVSRMAAQVAEQLENTASVLPHPDRNFRQI